MSNAPALSKDAIAKIVAQREAEERRFFALAFDYLRENAIDGDVHEYGGDRRPLLPLAIDVAGTLPVAGMRFFSFAPFAEPRKVPGRRPSSASPFHEFVSLKELAAATDGKANLSAGLLADILSRAERDRFMHTENKVALAIVHAPSGADLTLIFDFVEPLLTEGSLVYLADLHAGYRRTAAKEAGRAFLERAPRARLRLLRHMDVGWWGRSYMACLDSELPLDRL